MAELSPYLNFNGKTEEAFNLYRSVFGGEFTNFQRFSDMPSEFPSAEDDMQKILHVTLPISKETSLMGSDIPASAPASVAGSNISISINTSSEEEANKIFKGLSEGGKITMPLEKTFWGAYFGMLTDKYEVQWMVNYDYK
ncbi:MAG: VOC family protein [Bacteroidia bacterium]|nr:VOC family protein [Bacteroidia bacterium]